MTDRNRGKTLQKRGIEPWASIEKLRRINEIQKQAMDRWCPCSDHRDKTPPKYCPVCENEALQSEIERLQRDTLERAALVADREVLETPINTPVDNIAWAESECAKRIAASIRELSLKKATGSEESHRKR